MKNPWISLPEKAPFVLECDKQAILDFNSRASGRYQIHLELLPEPYQGDPQANIVLLNLNPGFDEGGVFFHQGNAYFLKTSRANLIHVGQEYPFYLLDPRNAAYPGCGWWSSKLRQLISRYGLKKVASAICNIEYFPYHSRSFGFSNLVIETQKYTFHLVEEILRRNAIVILMRGRNLWERSIPSLRGYHYYTLNSAQSASISEKNCPDGYAEILKMLG